MCKIANFYFHFQNPPPPVAQIETDSARSARLLLSRAAREGSTAFSFCRTSRVVSRDLAAFGTCKQGEISGAVWKKVGRRTNSSGGLKTGIRQSFRSTSRGGTNPCTLSTRFRFKFAADDESFVWVLRSWVVGKFCAGSRGAARSGAPAPEQKVKSIVGTRFCGNVAWREAQVLSPGSQ